MQCAPYSVPNAVCTVWCAPYNVHCSMFTTRLHRKVCVKYALSSVHRLLCIVKCAPYCALYNVHGTVCTVQCASYNLHHKLHTVQCAPYSVHHIVCTIQFGTYSVQYIVWYIQCTLFSVQCSLECFAGKLLGVISVIDVEITARRESNDLTAVVFTIKWQPQQFMTPCKYD